MRLDAPDQRIGATAQPQVVLDWGTQSTREKRSWEGLSAAVIAGDDAISYEHPYAVLGGPGTGKTQPVGGCHGAVPGGRWQRGRSDVRDCLQGVRHANQERDIRTRKRY